MSLLLAWSWLALGLLFIESQCRLLYIEIYFNIRSNNAMMTVNI